MAEPTAPTDAALDQFILFRFDAIGFPLCTLPIGLAPNPQGIALPIATTLGGPAFGEEKILSVIAAYQAVTDFHLKRPPDPGRRPRRGTRPAHPRGSASPRATRSAIRRCSGRSEP